MLYDKVKVEAALLEWEQSVLNFSLPTWDELPAIELYMDQVVMFLTQQLEPYLGGKPMTASTINNYVRTKVMPAPTKKRYSRLHLAYLIMICTLRQSMTIASIQQIIPVGLSEQAFRQCYQQYAALHRATSQNLVRHLRPAITTVSNAPEDGYSEVFQLAASTAVVSVLSKMLTEHLLYLPDAVGGEAATSVQEGEST